MPTRRLLIALSLLSLLLCRYADAQSPAPEALSVPRSIITLKYPPTLPGHAQQSQPAASGLFSQKQHAKFMIDTGTTGMWISENLAHSLALTSAPSQNPHEFIINGETLKQAVIPEFDLDILPSLSPLSGGSPEQHFSINGYVSVVPQQNTTFTEDDGTIGTDTLRGLGAVLFDGPKQQLTLISGGHLTENERKQLGFTAAASALVLTPAANAPGIYTIPIILENHGISENVALIVDTGSGVTMIPRKTAHTLGLEPSDFSTFTGLARTEKVDVARVETIKIGDLILHNIPVYYPDNGKEAPATIQPKGTLMDRLGMDILGGYRVLFDFPGGTLYLMPDQSEVRIIDK
jgi:predicted aspartyl protease